MRKSQRRFNEKKKNLSKKYRPRVAKKLVTVKKERVIEFLCRDENSRLLPGKKDTITKNKEKV